MIQFTRIRFYHVNEEGENFLYFNFYRLEVFHHRVKHISFTQWVQQNSFLIASTKLSLFWYSDFSFIKRGSNPAIGFRKKKTIFLVKMKEILDEFNNEENVDVNDDESNEVVVEVNDG